MDSITDFGRRQRLTRVGIDRVDLVPQAGEALMKFDGRLSHSPLAVNIGLPVVVVHRDLDAALVSLKDAQPGFPTSSMGGSGGSSLSEDGTPAGLLRFVLRLDRLASGEHVVVVRVYDASDNAGLAKVVLP